MRQSVFLPGDDPWLHLAQEEALFDALQPGDECLVLYVNRPCVVMGKHQNPLREVRFSELRARGWPLLRRFSGGGTVYHDLGNLNYSFLCSGEMDKGALLAGVVNTLAGLERAVTLTPQGDLLLGDAKVSGTASQVRRDKAMVHGTLLCGADLEGLHGVLGPTGTLEAFVGVASRPRPVVNLGLDPGVVARALLKDFGAVETANPSLLPAPAVLAGVDRYQDQLHSPDWLWDRTPPFTWAGDTRFGPLRVKVADGRILEQLSQERDDESANPVRMEGMRLFSREFFDLFDEETP